MENNSRIDDRRLAGEEEKRTANDGKDMWDLPPLAYHVSCLMADTFLSFVNKSFFCLFIKSNGSSTCYADTETSLF